MLREKKILIFILFICSLSSYQPLDPLFSYFTAISENFATNLNLDQFFTKLLLPSYSDLKKKAPAFHTTLTPNFKQFRQENNRILYTNPACNYGTQINVTKINFFCNNTAVTWQFYNGIVSIFLYFLQAKNT